MRTGPCTICQESYPAPECWRKRSNRRGWSWWYQSAAPRLRDRADHFLENAKAVGTVRRALDSSGFADEKVAPLAEAGEPASPKSPGKLLRPGNRGTLREFWRCERLSVR